MSALSRVLRNITPIPLYEPVLHASSGSFALDQLLGGGWPRGRLSLITGDANTGKTTLCYLAAASTRLTCYVDAEHSFDATRARALGIYEPSAVLFSPKTLEHALSFVLGAIASKQFSLVILDSLTALVPEAEAQGRLTQWQSWRQDLQARLLNHWFYKLQQPLAASGTALLVVAQVRSRIGVLNTETYVPGGCAKERMAAVILRTEPLKRTLDKFDIRCYTTKNMHAPLGRTEIEIG